MTDQIVHIRCGSDIRESLRTAGFEGDFLEWGDPVCRGPVPAGMQDDDYRRMRARFISNWDILSETRAMDRLQSESKALDTLEKYDRIILWFEHDLYDQAVLIDLLSRLSEKIDLLDRMRLMTVDRFSGEERFVGFGQLSPDQLRSLQGLDVPVSEDMIRQAQRAWAAFRADTPEALHTFTVEEGDALPFLRSAMRRHLMELPSTRNGLSMTERLMLDAVADGAKTGVDTFRKMYRETEPAPFLGDVMFFHDMAGLIDATQPALTATEDWRDEFDLTDFGRQLLAEEADWVRTNGIDQWRGGVHLTGNGPVWRWSPDEDRPVLA
ncbi:DUF1835 domain-containing protein [Hwanghaeella grinnelliae]|uniref:DUF1835 domain-containing protein n=1 Tax=Hwanghaeella grinnelliae TaxID=2500179 RepID=A0A437QH89_9PROT|nr:DUF1835 domain-containing protein [Hwanghaeella grinnelliae]RVU33670.1 DUF1835 domain-containing protein [Hwanghaeella grinnelliae]